MVSGRAGPRVSVKRDVHASPHSGIDAGRQRGEKAFEVALIFQSADLDLIAVGQ